MLSIEIISAFLGIAIGSVLALTGAGGAILAIPLLVYFLPISIFQAAPIALLAIFMASSIGAIQGLWKGTVRYKTALLIASTGIVFAPFGVQLAQFSPSNLLSIILTGLLLLVGFLTWQQAKHHSQVQSQIAEPACVLNPVTAKLFWTASCTKRLISTGALTGLLSGLLGVGGGFIIVPNLHKNTNFSHQSVTATTLAAVSLITISSIASHIHSSPVNWSIALPFTISTTLSMIIATELIQHKIPKQLAQQVFATLCFIAALQLIRNTLI